MIGCKRLVAVCCLATAPLLGQDEGSQAAQQPAPAQTAPAQPERPATVPLPFVEPTVVPPGKLQPGTMMTTKDKVNHWKRNTFGPRAIVNRLAWTGISQWQDHPEEWPQGMEGFGDRFAARMGRMVFRNSLMLGIDVAMGTDPRYDQCDCEGFGGRSLHAWKRVLVARKDNGGQTLNVSRIAGGFVTPMVAYQWYPDRLNTTERQMMSGVKYLAFRGATNMLREFWPDIKRKLRRNK